MVLRVVWFLRAVWFLRVTSFLKVVWFLRVVCFLKVVWVRKVTLFLRAVWFALVEYRTMHPLALVEYPLSASRFNGQILEYPFIRSSISMRRYWNSLLSAHLLQFLDIGISAYPPIRSNAQILEYLLIC